MNEMQLSLTFLLGWDDYAEGKTRFGHLILLEKPQPVQIGCSLPAHVFNFEDQITISLVAQRRLADVFLNIRSSIEKLFGPSERISWSRIGQSKNPVHRVKPGVWKHDQKSFNVSVPVRIQVSDISYDLAVANGTRNHCEKGHNINKNLAVFSLHIQVRASTQSVPNSNNSHWL